MILLISQGEFDFTTDVVFDWVKHLGGNVVRLNGSDLLKKEAIKISVSNDGIVAKIKDIPLDEVNIIWYRRWIHIDYEFSKNHDLDKYLGKEFKGLSQYVFQALKDKKWYNRHNHLKPYPSKIEQLDSAINNKIKIPESLICSSKDDLMDFYKLNDNSIITKNIFEMGSFKTKGKVMGTFTHSITKENIKKVSEEFSPSLIQKNIAKKYEIRVFYNKGVCYSMAIFSSTNDKTKSDFRNYDLENPNRFVPIKLPDDDIKKIDNLMNDIGLETGSLDFIYSYKNEMIFLEVNPLGQFGMVSGPCNYYLEKIIANDLIKLDNN